MASESLDLGNDGSSCRVRHSSSGLRALLKRGRRNYKSQEVKVIREEPTETADLSSWKLMNCGACVGPMPSACKWHLCSLVCCMTPSSRFRTCPWNMLFFFSESIPHAGIPHPAGCRGRILGLPQLAMSCFIDANGRPDPF